MWINMLGPSRPGAGYQRGRKGAERGDELSLRISMEFHMQRQLQQTENNKRERQINKNTLCRKQHTSLSTDVQMYTYYACIHTYVHICMYIYVRIHLYVNLLFYFDAPLFAPIRAAFICCSRQLLTI